MKATPTQTMRVLQYAVLLLTLGSMCPTLLAENGLAAIYSHRLDGHKTASGKLYKPTGMTVAHKTLPFGTRVRITNKRNGRQTTATVTDRGPMQAGRVVDVSPAVARALGMKRGAMTEVDVEKQ